LRRLIVILKAPVESFENGQRYSRSPSSQVYAGLMPHLKKQITNSFY
jgi:hypothetical protein